MHTCTLRALFKYHARMVSLLAYTNIDNVSICFPFIFFLCELLTQCKALRERNSASYLEGTLFSWVFFLGKRRNLTPRDLATVSSCMILHLLSSRDLLLFIVMIRFALCLLTIGKAPWVGDILKMRGSTWLWSFPIPFLVLGLLFCECLHLRALLQAYLNMTFHFLMSYFA
jgi:hypothetical protein